MGYVVLIGGVALWSLAHLFKRLAPERRARLGDPGKGLVALLLILSIVLMVYGYRWAEYVYLWPRYEWATHVNNLFNLIAVWLFVASNAGGWIGARMRHPQLTAVKIWALAHLLVNGDLASLVLFGGLLAWAVVEVIVINRAARAAAGATAPAGAALAGAEGMGAYHVTAPPPKAPGPWWRDAAAFAIALVLYGAIAWVHTLFGLWPFG